MKPTYREAGRLLILWMPTAVVSFGIWQSSILAGIFLMAILIIIDSWITSVLAFIRSDKP